MLDDVMTALDAVLPRLRAATGTPGVAVAVATSTELRTAAAGYADLAAGVPMTADTAAPAGSLSKPITGLAFLQLVEAGAVDLETPIDALLPAGLRGRDPAPVTAAMLAAHQGGYYPDTVAATMTAPEPVAEFVRRRHGIGRALEYGGALPLLTAPGGYSYSSFGISVLGCAVEHATQEPFADHVGRHVLAPAGMKASGFDDGTARSWTGERATGYMAFGDWCVPSPPIRSSAYPGAGMQTSAADVGRLLQSLLRTSRGEHGLVRPETLATMVTPRVARGGPAGRRSFSGLTFELADPELGDSWWWGHSAAFLYGFWWDVRVWPKHDIAVVAVGNRWDMARFHNPATRSAPGLAAEWVGRWALSGAPGALPADPGRARWTGPRPTSQTSRWVGAVVGERVHGLLSVADPLPAATLAAMTGGARGLGDELSAARDDGGGWDVEAFGRGVEEARAVAPDPDAIAAFGRGLGPQAGLWMLECGASTADMTMPIDFFARPPA
ncbi:serine hydrolase domain-containing protein [Umezawaea sp. Da 62-37]|uniref:serine hydrolase domain-containing protein n=1 Tax=Umezawaea sp. Da 62-37 TaxID=3075927 RepID=UPI0028F6C1C4|nr:serine hydrolase domain-containing protein [Umezawaea sp. Da 62-37]WNV88968.1 serine hydrolase domain-containing protein [Umezawaea sp. Da 62-37]